MLKLTAKSLAEMIDHTNIRPTATERDIRKTCQEAKRYSMRGVDVNPKWIGFVAKYLKNTKIKTIVLIDPPMGQSAHYKRVEMCQKAKQDGADELDIVINVIDVKYERYDDVLEDLKVICRILPTKVIIGSGYLTDDEIKKASELVKQAGAICVKTATEKDPIDNAELPEKAKHLEIMKVSAPGLLIKASGKIKTYQDALMMIEAGADIIGTSSSVKIVQGFKQSLKRKTKTKKK